MLLKAPAYGWNRIRRSAWSPGLERIIPAPGSTRSHSRGYLTDGIKVLPEEIDLRYFRAYSDLRTFHHDDPVSHFTKHGLTMPKACWATSLSKPARSLREVMPTSLRQSDLPETYCRGEGRPPNRPGFSLSYDYTAVAPTGWRQNCHP